MGALRTLKPQRIVASVCPTEPRSEILVYLAEAVLKVLAVQVRQTKHRPDRCLKVAKCSFANPTAGHKVGMTSAIRSDRSGVRQSNPTGKFLLAPSGKSVIKSARLTRYEGRAHVTNARWDAVDAECALDVRA
jgi:hypothetical protein